jgi:chromosome segregation ATPase
VVLGEQNASRKMSNHRRRQTKSYESDGDSDSEIVNNDVGTKGYVTGNHTMSGGSGERGLEAASTNSENFDLLPMTLHETVQQLSTAQTAIESLKNEYKRHANDIQEAIQNREKVAFLEAQIQNNIITIETLGDIHKKSEEKLKEGRESLNREKEKFEKQMKVLDAERKHREDKEMEKREVELRKKILDLETTNKTLSEMLETQKETIKKKEEERIKAAETIEDLKTLKSSLKKDVQNLTRDLNKARTEFELNDEPITF